MKTRSRLGLFVSILFTVMLFGASHSVYAHTHLQSSEPAAGANLSAAPETLTLVFDGEVNLVRLNLSHEERGEVTLDFEASAEKARDFVIPLPTLESGRYTARWAAIGEDGHLVQGSVRFSVNASP